MWGVIAVALFAMDKEQPLSGSSVSGIFYQSDSRESWVRLGWQMLGLLVINGWTGAHMLLLFSGLKKIGWLRVDDSTIAGVGGLDMAEHGEYVVVPFCLCVTTDSVSRLSCLAVPS